MNFFKFFEAILSAFSVPSNRILSKYFFSLNNFLISVDIGLILSIITCDKFFLKSEKFFPENLFIDPLNLYPLNLNKYQLNF